MTIRKLLCIGALALIASPAFAETIIMTPQQQQSLGITVAAPSPAGLLASQRLPGEIAVPAGQERVLSTPQSGLVEALLVAPGQSVRQGQPLAYINSPDLLLLQRDFLQTLTQAQLAQSTLDRDSELFKDGIIAERRHLASRSQHQALAAELAQRRQSLKLAGMPAGAIQRLEQQGELSSRIVLHAPIAGQVLVQLVTLGQRVDPMTPLMRIGHLSPLWLEIHAPVEVLGAVREGTPVRIPQYQAEGRIIAIIRNINKSDQTMHVRAEITRNAERLSPGQFVEAELAGSQPGAQFSVPKQSIIRNGPDSFVFVRTAKGFDPVKVNVVAEQADHAVISGPLGKPSHVVVSGTAVLKAAWLGTSGE